MLLLGTLIALDTTMCRSGCSDLTRRALPLATILVVDEVLDSRVLIKRLLERCGHDVTTCGDAKAAVQWISDNPMDLVVVDINPSDPSSARLARLLKGTNGRLKALGITNPGTEPPQQAQWDALVFKPIDIDVV